MIHTPENSTNQKPNPLPPGPPRDSVLEALIAGTLGPLSRLTDGIDLTLEELANWVKEPTNREKITNLVTLLDAQTQLIICQHRLVAVVRLADVASSQASPETVRRACADLLKTRLIDPYKEDKRPVREMPDPPLDEAKILEAMEQIGRMPTARW